MHQRAGVKLHHGGMPNASTGRLLLCDKQDEKRMASTGECSRDVERYLSKRAPVASIDPPAGHTSPSES
jgi:hypothetical protein